MKTHCILLSAGGESAQIRDFLSEGPAQVALLLVARLDHKNRRDSQLSDASTPGYS